MQTTPAIARALNTFGENVVNEVVAELAESTGLDPHEIRNSIIVYQADAASLEWGMDASVVIPQQSPNWQRPWDRPNDNSFDQGMLLNIVTAKDDRVCPVCEEAAADSPYSTEQINELAAKWRDYEPPSNLGPRTNLIHPNCRCETVPWRGGRRQLPVNTNANPGGGGGAQRMTARQLGRSVMDELRLVIRAVE